jgi:HEAT repeat protein
LGKQTPLAVLVTALHDEDKEVRRVATYQFEAWKGQASVEPLIAALNDKEWDVREAAIMALKELGTCVPLEVFLPALEDEMYLVRELSMGALAERAEQVPMELFVRTLRNQPEDLDAARSRAAGHSDLYACLGCSSPGKMRRASVHRTAAGSPGR